MHYSTSSKFLSYPSCFSIQSIDFPKTSLIFSKSSTDGFLPFSSLLAMLWLMPSFLPMSSWFVSNRIKLFFKSRITIQLFQIFIVIFFFAGFHVKEAQDLVVIRKRDG